MGDLIIPTVLPERTPDGRSPKELGAKLDGNKLRGGLVLGDFARALEQVCEAGTYGANKYTDSNWLHVDDAFDRYNDAFLRHWLARKKGEKLDSDSGLLHLAHEAWNALAVLELYLREVENGNTPG